MSFFKIGKSTACPYPGYSYRFLCNIGLKFQKASLNIEEFTGKCLNLVGFRRII